MATYKDGCDEGRNVAYEIAAQPPHSALKKEIEERLNSPVRRPRKEELESRLEAAEHRKKEVEQAKISKAANHFTHVAAVIEKAAEQEVQNMHSQAEKLASQLEKAESNRLQLSASKTKPPHGLKDTNSAAAVAYELERKENLASERRAEQMAEKLKKLSEHSEHVDAVRERRRSLSLTADT